MGKVLCFLLFAFIPFIAWGQIWVEHFNYTTSGQPGDTLPDGTIWKWHSGNGGIPIRSGSLSYAGYMAPEGNKVEVSFRRGTDMSRDLDKTYTSGTLYCSFLMQVIGAPTDTGSYFLHFYPTFVGRVHIRWNSTTSKFQIGIANNTTTAIVWYTDEEFDLNTTYLVVLKYDFKGSGTGDDVASLWLFKEGQSIPSQEPSPLIQTTGNGTNQITRLALRQASGIGTIEIDEIRVGLSWGDAPLPVQVSNLIAEALGRYIRIKIETGTENPDFLGFNVYRSRDGENFKLVASYENVAELKAKRSGGFGSKYEFVDKDVSVAGDYYYKIEAVGLNERKFVGDVLKVFFNPPTSYSLSQNYPNPFNPETLIEFEIPEDVYVVLVVYDVMGREVRRLVDGMMSAGYHKVRFNGADIPSGVYYYKLQAGKFVDVKKMVLMK